MGRRWTPAEDATLLRILKTLPDASYAEVAQSMNRSPKSVWARSLRLRRKERSLPTRMPSYTQEEKRRLIQLAETHTLAEIAEELGRSVHSVRCYCHRNGIMINKLKRLAVCNRVNQLRDKLDWKDLTKQINKEFKTHYTPASLGRLLSYHAQ